MKENLELEFIYGYNCDSSQRHEDLQFSRNKRNETKTKGLIAPSEVTIHDNLFYTAGGDIIYHVAQVAVLYTRETHSQRFYTEHSGEITALALHPSGKIAATGERAIKSGKNPCIKVWKCDTEIKTLATLKGTGKAPRYVDIGNQRNFKILPKYALYSVGNGSSRVIGRKGDVQLFIVIDST
jgi:WD40 repeat protein